MFKLKISHSPFWGFATRIFGGGMKMAFPQLPEWIGYFAMAVGFALFCCCIRDWITESKKSSEKALQEEVLKVQLANALEQNRQLKQQKDDRAITRIKRRAAGLDPDH